MELIFFGVGIGMIISAALVGIGVVIGDRNNKRQSNDNNIRTSDLSSGDGGRSGNNGRNIPHTIEEKVMVLNTFRTGATWFEKCVLDEIAEDLIELDEKKFVEEQAENPKPIWKIDHGQWAVSEDGGETWTMGFDPFDVSALDDEPTIRFCPMGYTPEQE